ncbi:MAG TPA: 3'-5' exonuclease [Bacteroidia bacterium]|nr:3'-5' exonuclease [Bacteroidia bacterium]HNP98342.1 3'-5' exonuclease [Bacteroidia bacterium]
MLSTVKLSNILFVDIETVPQYPAFSEVPEPFNELWEKKSKMLRAENESPESLYERAGIYAEFGKIVCISCGYYFSQEEFKTFSFAGDDEKEILSEFSKTVNSFCSGSEKQLCAHNGKEFDFPYIARRMLIHGMNLPHILNTAGKKPWEVNHLDTMELWKFGDYKSYTSLVLLAAVLGIPSPKDDIDGSRVGEVYWKEKNIERIAHYCEKDVQTIGAIMKKYKGFS